MYNKKLFDQKEKGIAWEIGIFYVYPMIDINFLKLLFFQFTCRVLWKLIERKYLYDHKKFA